MVVALLAGVYAGLGLNAPSALDRRAELWFAVVVWVDVISGAYVGGNLGTGMVLGGLVILILWSVLHFPNILTIETPMPRQGPLFILVVCMVTAILLGVAITMG
jgi:hypothetical protein